MKKFVSNSEIIDIFKEIEEIKNSDINDKENIITSKQNEIILKMSFVVENRCVKYKNFQNYEDLMQEGFIGLIKAVKRFDYTRFPNFFVYSDQWIFNHIAQSAKKFDIVYTPFKHKTVYQNIDLSTEDMPNMCPENTCINNEHKIIIYEEIQKLLPKEKNIINSIYGVNKRPDSLRNIGNQNKLTHEGIRQIQIKALKKLFDKELIRTINDE